MTEIKPKYVDGEPVCSEACIQFDSKNYPCVAHEEIRFCKIEKLCIQPGDPCIPAIMEARDGYKTAIELNNNYWQRENAIIEKENERLKKDIKYLENKEGVALNEIANLKAERDERKCCGNCINYEPWEETADTCKLTGYRAINGAYVCDKWQPEDQK